MTPTKLADLQSEAEFQDSVLELARLAGWMVFHDHDSRRNAAGLPDLVMVHPRRYRLVLVELKRERGRVRPEQAAWMAALTSVAKTSGGAVYAAVWRPSDWPEIERTLNGRSTS